MRSVSQSDRSGKSLTKCSMGVFKKRVENVVFNECFAASSSSEGMVVQKKYLQVEKEEEEVE